MIGEDGWFKYRNGIGKTFGDDDPVQGIIVAADRMVGQSEREVALEGEKVGFSVMTTQAKDSNNKDTPIYQEYLNDLAEINFFSDRGKPFNSVEEATKWVEQKARAINKKYRGKI